MTSTDTDLAGGTSTADASERPTPAGSPDAAAVPGLELTGVTKDLGGRTIVHRMDLAVAPGELICLLGPSGCGKTTTLRMIGGFLTPDAGRLRIAGKDYTHAPPEKRPTAMVFQNYALWPHMSVFGNIAFGLKIRKMPKSEIRDKVDWALDLVKLTHHRDSPPARISGGEQQRVALARALVLEPQVLLLDEPLSNLDAKLRVQVREDIREIQQRLGITTVLVTHDQDEALSVADRIAVMNGGRIEHLAAPSLLYSDPRTTFVASFIGAMNWFDTGPSDDGIPLADGSVLPCRRISAPDGDRIGVRPEDVAVSASGTPATLEAVVVRSIPRGHYREVVMTAGGSEFRSYTGQEFDEGEHVGAAVTRALVYADGLLQEAGETAPGRMTLAIAHRGEPVGHIENTMEAVRAAIDAGAPMIEVDVRLSADGHPVILHDADLARIWGVPEALSSLSWSEVAQVRDPAGHRIPDLAEVATMAIAAGVQLMVDLPDEDAGPVAHDVLRHLGATDACLFAGETAVLREHSGSARIALTWDRVEPPDATTLAFFRPEYFNPHFQLLTASLADRMHAAGIAVSAWTVDHPRDMRAVIVQGADAVVTNRISELITLLGDPS